MKIVPFALAMLITGISASANAAWFCTVGGTPITLDKVTVTGHATTPTWTGSTVGDVSLGCAANSTFYFNWNLTVPGSKEAHATALAAFLSGSSVCLQVLNCTGSGGQPVIDQIQINK